jgi:ceroid-lipofuscinosis MFS transporter 7
MSGGWSLRNLQNSFIVNGWVTFVSDAARGVLFPALWPLVHHLGGGGTDQGYLVASFSVGRLMVTYILGIFASRYGHRSALLVSQCFLMLGSLLWANAYLLKLPSLYLAQALMGLGTGYLGVTRSFVSEQTSSTERTARLARLTSVQYAGFAVTPLLGSGLVELGALWSQYWKYALPAYTVFLFAVSCAISLLLCYKDIDYDEVRRSGARRSIEIPLVRPLIGSGQLSDSEIHAAAPASDQTWISMSSSETKDTPHTPPERIRDCVRLFVMMNFVILGAFVVYETLGSKILLDDLDLSELEMGSIVGCSGIIGTLQLIYFESLYSSRFSNMILILNGLLVVCAAQVLVIKYSDSHSYSRGPFGLSLFLVYGFGYPIANSGVLGSYSELQKQAQHASAQAMFVFFGSLSRIITPISVGHIEGSVETGPFSLVLIVLSLCVSYLSYYAQHIEDTIHPKTRWTAPGTNDWRDDRTTALVVLGSDTPPLTTTSTATTPTPTMNTTTAITTTTTTTPYGSIYCTGRLMAIQVAYIFVALSLVVLGVITLGINSNLIELN